MTPRCADLPSALGLDIDLSRIDFERRLETVGTAHGGWVRIAACRDCGQVWRVDLEDRLQVGMAIKVDAPGLLDDNSEHQIRLAYLVSSFGGETEHGCAWADCLNVTLRGLAICAEHAYRAGLRAKGH
ncbi:MAG TPA: hypothetical protein VMF13_01730 [Luteitalea sp.]|nr:hypothetical protein [Luteitalea sp.]